MSNNSITLDHTNQLLFVQPEGYEVENVQAVVQAHAGAAHTVNLLPGEHVAALGSGTGTLQSVHMTHAGAPSTFSGGPNYLNAPANAQISITVSTDGNRCTLTYRVRTTNFHVTWRRREALDFKIEPPPPLLELDDLAFDSARRTTVDDLNVFGRVDDWLRAAEQLSGEGGVHYSDQWSFYMFWINDIRYADRRHQGNEITTGDSTKTVNERETRTVIQEGPKLIASTSTSTPPVAESTTYVNDSDEDQSYTITYTDTSGSDSQLSVTKHASIDVGANIAIGGFGINASGNVSQDQTSSLTKNDSKSTSKENTVVIKAHKQLTVTTTVTTNTTVDTYETTIQLRGRLHQPTINVPAASGGFADIGQWYNIADLPNIGASTTQKAEFQLTTVTHQTQVAYHESDVPKPKKKPVPPKQPMYLPAFQGSQLNEAVYG
ncbi:hypothetical protein H2198_003087 [Neophaeococcomyces mojaviensis]|uniref:Uncharacterized protein n=1 Tax=Neophaeococcomyces mojaviensis TaxID=3383035 RepID=A0ACC3ACZ8_9EURO|nr:hypothetical protein H2198_003087 [Knufia sp. JES_112]